MCFGKKPEEVKTAAPPPPPIEPVEPEEIGAGRRKENKENFGAERPQYRVRAAERQRPMNPNAQIRM